MTIKNWITFGGTDCRTYKVYISGNGTFNSPERDGANVSIPGRNGDIFLDWHNTWFQNGQILREVAYNPLGNQFYEPVPRLDGTCGILEILVIKDHDEPDQQENWIRVTLYDWDENGKVKRTHGL